VFVNVYNKPINNLSMEDKMESCDKCGTIVYERNLAMFGHKFICPSCQGLSDEELEAYWTEQEQDELHTANGGA
jgi:DNA-directed RNA polymerase subunit M/transcription elongation factor TFIIS